MKKEKGEVVQKALTTINSPITLPHLPPSAEMDDGERRWEEMETDCLVNIFSMLGIDDLAAAVPFVCCSWAAAARDPLSWRLLDLRSLDFMPWSSFAKKFTGRNKVSRFSFSGFMRLAVCRSAGLAAEIRLPELASAEDLILASNECPKLRTLVLPNLTSDNEARIPDLMANWKKMESLEMQSKPSNFPQLASEIGKNCKHLSELVMPCSSIKKEDASAIVTSLPNLRSLDVSRSFLPKEELLLMLEGCRELGKLNAKNCVGFEAADEEVKRKGRRIKIFEIEGSKVEDDRVYESDECDDLYVHVI